MSADILVFTDYFSRGSWTMSFVLNIGFPRFCKLEILFFLGLPRPSYYFYCRSWHYLCPILTQLDNVANLVPKSDLNSTSHDPHFLIWVINSAHLYRKNSLWVFVGLVWADWCVTFTLIKKIHINFNGETMPRSAHHNFCILLTLSGLTFFDYL